MKMGRISKAHATMAFVQINCGAYHVITKLALNSGVNQIAFCVIRDIIAVTILAPIAFFAERRIRPPLTFELVKSCFVLGFIGIFGNQLLFIVGLQLTSPTYAAALQPSIPVFTFLLALAMGTDTLNWGKSEGYAKIAGTVLCVCGAIITALYKGMTLIKSSTVLHENLSNDNAFLESWQIGIICLIGNCLCMSVYLTLQARLLRTYPAGITVTALSYVFAASFMVITGVIFERARSNWFFTTSEILAVLYVGIISSALNYGLLTWCNRIIGPSLVAVYVPLQPVAAAALSCVFLNSPLYLGSLVGGSLIIAGLYLVIWGQQKAVRHIVSDAKQPLL